MESFGLYLLKSAVWLTGFTIVFLVVLRNERYFQLNRAYLLSGIFASVVFPLFTWHYAVVLPSVPSEEIFIPEMSTQVMVYTDTTITPGIPVFWWFYLVGIGWFAFRLFRQTWIMVRKLRKTGYVINGPVKLVRTPEYVASFSFFSFVFVNPSTSDIETEEIVNHECGHIQKRHWFDLLFVELLCMMQWFNPFVWIYSHFVRQNHEYLADEMALQRTSSPEIYRATLLNQMLGVPVIRLANSFSYSLNKKRFKMMKKIIESPYRKLKLLFVIPLMALVFYAFAEPEYKNDESAITHNEQVSQIDFNKDLKDGVVKGQVVNPDGKPLAGAAVIIKNTTTGTISDKEGNFKLKNVPKDGELVFSFVGYQTIQIKADPENPMVIKMALATIGLDKVTVVGYGDVKKEPLYIVNGTPVTGEIFRAINPETLYSVNFIKGESATAKYGEKGVNGAVELTLKKGPTFVGEKDVDVIINGKESDLKTLPSPLGYSVRTIDSKNPPLILLDGEIIDKAKMDAINPKNIELIKVSKDEIAINKYGDKAKNGVIEITSKKRNFDQPNSDIAKDQYRTEPIDNKDPQLFVLDGVITEKSKADKILQEGVGSVTIIKGKDAIKKYGEKGKNGVMEINSKKKSDTSTTRFKKPVANAHSEGAKNTAIFTVVEEMPEFPGGNDALMKFITGNVIYPEKAKAEKATGQVIANFVVRSSGKVENVKVIRSVHPALDAEAIRVIRLMPDWKPGKQHGEAVDVSSAMPIQFTLQAKDKKSDDVVVVGYGVQKKDQEVFVKIDQMPKFPGGEEALMKFIIENVKYPEQAKKDKIVGTVIVNLIITNNGKIGMAKIVRSVRSDLDAEALRVVGLMPDWQPGKQGGKAVNVYYTIPIKFALQ